MTDSSKLTNEQFHEEFAKLGPKPPWWRPFARRRWYAAETALYYRREDLPQGLDRLYAAINEQIDSDSRRRR